MSFWAFIGVIVFLVTCGEVLTKWVEASGSRLGAGAGAERDELNALREQVVLLSEEVGRLSAEQRFLTDLLEDRPRLGSSADPASGWTQPKNHSEPKDAI